MPNKQTPSKKKPTDKAALAAAKLVARAYTLLKRGGRKNAVDGLAVACTEAIRHNGACLIPVTTNTFKELFSLPGVDGETPTKKLRREFVDSIFRQRNDAGLAVVGSIKVWETKGIGSIRF
jgi:hypothetical protein